MQFMTAPATIRTHLKRLPALTAFASVVGLAVLTACGGSTEPAKPVKDVTPAAITASPTDTLRAAVGAQVATPLTVTVKNKTGDLIDSAIVTFGAATGSGTVSATSVRTVAGVATTTWTLGGTAGVQTVTASVGTLPAVTFTAIASAGAASAVTKVAGDAQSAAAGANTAVAPSVKVADSFGNPVANVLVTFAVASGGGSVTGGLQNTNASGIATVGAWKLGPTIGANTLTATVAGIAPVTFAATGVAGAVSQVRFTNLPAPTVSVGQTFKFTTQALDAGNNVVTATITYTSDNAAIATVDATGTVTGVGAGTANIIAAFGTITASAPISVIGHPVATVVAALPMGSGIKGLAISGTTAYAGLSTSGKLGQVNLTTLAAVAPVPLTGSPADVAVGGAGPVIAVPVGGPLPLVWFVNPATQLRTDSIELAASPFKGVMNSTGTKLFVDMQNFNMATIDVASRTITSTVPLAGTVQTMKMFGDSVIYAGTVLGNVFRIDARTGAVTNPFASTPFAGGVADLDVSRDGKTLFTINGTNSIVTMTPILSGGLSGTVDFGSNLFSVAISPDGLQLWGGMVGKMFVAPFQNGQFTTSLVSSTVLVPGATFTRIVFSPLGDIVVAIDAGGLNLVIFK